MAWTEVRENALRGYVMHLADSSAMPIPVTNTPGFHYEVTVNGDRVVWMDDRGSTGDSYELRVMARDLLDPPTSAFTDLRDAWYISAIEGIAAENIIGGYTDGTFRPQNPVLRAQFAKMLVNSLELEVYEDIAPLPFADVDRPDSDLYPDDYVAVAHQNGLIKGFSDTRFGPYQDMTRAQLLTMVVRAAERFQPECLLPVPAGWEGILTASDSVHGSNIAKAEYSGLLSGIQLVDFHLWGKATREEVAQILQNLRMRVHGVPGAWCAYKNPYWALPVEVIAGVAGAPFQLWVSEDHHDGGFFITEYEWSRAGVRYTVVGTIGMEGWEPHMGGHAKVILPADYPNPNSGHVCTYGDLPLSQLQQMAEEVAAELSAAMAQ